MQVSTFRKITQCTVSEIELFISKERTNGLDGILGISSQAKNGGLEPKFAPPPPPLNAQPSTTTPGHKPDELHDPSGTTVHNQA